MIWFRCEREISKIGKTNPFGEALDVRGNKLMENVALATAVQVNPRLHHDETLREMLGDIVVDVEVISFIS